MQVEYETELRCSAEVHLFFEVPLQRSDTTVSAAAKRCNAQC
jgi:hypothetical protein